MSTKNSPQDILHLAQSVILEESKAVKELAQLLTDDFAHAVENIIHSKGRIIVTGIGKSANIASKVVATFNSTGTPSIFMHAADAIHGDLGIIQENDTVICISKSGNTPEIKVLLPLIKDFGNKIIAITGNTASYLAQHADYVLNTYVAKEACPNNLAPTTSTTAQLVMGDALAVVLLYMKGFTPSDFAKYHPGGALGKKLYLRVSDLMVRNEKPAVDPDASINEVIIEISQKRLGTTAVVNSENHVIGIITDGDLRRMIEKNHDFSTIKAKDIMSENPRTVSQDSMAVEALQIMENHNITQLLVVQDLDYMGVIHLHDILKEGIL
jgi:arabinose-5-phosphate isomerase